MESQPPVPPSVPPDVPSTTPGGFPPGPPPSYPPPPTPPGGGALPWEQPGAPFLGALVDTTKLLLLQPAQAFERMSLTISPWRPLAYALIVGCVGFLFTCIYNVVFSGAMRQMMSHFGNTAQGEQLASAAFIWAYALLSPLWVSLGILIGAAILHLFLMIFGAAGRGFGATFRVMCYTGAPNVLMVLPFCGAIAAGIWSLVLLIIGIAIAQRTTRTRAAMAILLPGIACCVCGASLGFLAGFLSRFKP